MEHDDKKLEAFVRDIMSNDTLEKPSLDFTNIVMSGVDAISNSTITPYKPLISKPVWACLFTAFACLVGYVYLKEPVSELKWLETIDLSLITSLFKNISINFSKTLVYAIVLFAVMILIQVPFLKYYFNKRMAV